MWSYFLFLKYPADGALNEIKRSTRAKNKADKTRWQPKLIFFSLFNDKAKLVKCASRKFRRVSLHRLVGNSKEFGRKSC